MSDYLRINKRGLSVATGFALNFIFIILLPSAALAEQYNVTTLGTLGGYYSEASRITDQGVIVGGSTIYTGAWHAFRWYNNQFEDLDVPDSFLTSTATAYNNNGQVVGFATGQYQSQYAYLWENYVWTALGTLQGPGLEFSIATDINDYAQICGYSFAVGPGSGMRAWIWENGVFTDLGTLGGEKSSASAINEQGQVVGYAQIYNPNEYRIHAFIWEDGQMTDLGVLPGEVNSVANDINEVNQIAGYSYHIRETYPFGEVPRPCIWNNGEIAEIVLPQGYAKGAATAINNNGDVVGWMSTSIFGGTYVPFIWKDGILYDLNYLISPNSGWILQKATDINNSGQIVGEGIAPESWLQGFLLTPAVTGLDEKGNQVLPSDFITLNNYPNPFNAATTIRYSLSQSLDVSIEIYDIVGRTLLVLDEGMQDAGEHQIVWNADDQPSGMYFYRMTAGPFTATGKMTLLK